MGAEANSDARTSIPHEQRTEREKERERERERESRGPENKNNSDKKARPVV